MIPWIPRQFEAWLNSFSLSFCAFSCELHCMVGLSFHLIPFISAWLLASGELGSILNEMDVASNFLDLDVEVKYYFRSFDILSPPSRPFSSVRAGFFISFSNPAMLAWSLPLFQSRIWSFPAFMRSLKGSSSFLDFMLTSSGPWGVLDLLAFIPSRSAPLPIGKAVLGQRPSGPFSSSRRLVQIHFFSSSFFAFNCWCVSCWLRLRCPSSFFHFSSIQPSLSFRCEPLKLSCYASLPHPWFGHEPSKADFPLRSSNGNLLSSSNLLEKEKARSATNLIVVASLFYFCGISINRKIRVEIIVLLRVRSCTFHALVRFLFTYLS